MPIRLARMYSAADCTDGRGYIVGQLMFRSLWHPSRWSSGYSARLLTRRSRDRIQAAVAEFSMEAEMLEALVLRFIA